MIMTVESAYDIWSATYDTDRNLTRELDLEVAQSTLGHLQGNRIIEIGCGSGKNTRWLARLGRSVHALDFSEGMIGKAMEKVTADNVRFDRADITKRWPCRDRSAGLVVCDLVLEHIGDLSTVFAEAARCLVPGGRFFICELHPFRQYRGTRANFRKNGRKHEIPAYVHHASDFTGTAAAHGFGLESLREWWHAEDAGKPPRLISFLLHKS